MVYFFMVRFVQEQSFKCEAQLVTTWFSLILAVLYINAR